MFGKTYSVIKLLALKVKFGKRLNIGKVRQIIRADTEIRVGKDAFLSLVSVNVNTNVHLVCEHGVLIIGEGAIFNRNCTVVCRQKIQIGDHCLFGPNVCIFDHDHIFDSNGVSAEKFECSEIVIEEGCWIGAGSIILRGTHIGKNSVIGAGTVIKGHIPPHSMVLSSRDPRVIPMSFFAQQTENHNSLYIKKASTE